MAINSSWSEAGAGVWDQSFQPFLSNSTADQWHLLLPVITAAFCLVILYIGWIKPINLNKVRIILINLIVADFLLL